MPIHIKADPEDVAETVLLPGNPERAEYITENFLEEPVLYNDYRKMYGYTGEYNGKKISVQTTGMGVPSLCIILEELNMLGTEEWIRVGTCGALQSHMELTDLVLAQSSASIGTSVDRIDLEAGMSPPADFELLNGLYEETEKLKTPVHIGQIVTSDYFYGGEAYT
ncbi:MAG: purine-nucleoside phosphorylase, partial [Candidatus Natronoplasma sp.]